LPSKRDGEAAFQSKFVLNFIFMCVF